MCGSCFSAFALSPATATMDGMTRRVTARIRGSVQGSTEIAAEIAVARGWHATDETLTITLDGVPVEPTELLDTHGTRVHLIRTESDGSLAIDYSATVDADATDETEDPLDRVRYLRPSRYCESDSLGPTAAAEFSGVEGHALLDAVSSWVGTQLAYVSGSSLPTDGAVRTLLARQGVCRDYAHLCIALLRARGVPARLAAVYAPGLAPMDFHAVAEAFVEGAWHVVDATTLAPRSTMVRIATGRDAADTAFLSTVSGVFALDEVEVTATADVLPDDDVTALVRLS